MPDQPTSRPVRSRRSAGTAGTAAAAASERAAAERAGTTPESGAGGGAPGITPEEADQLLDALTALRRGDFSTRVRLRRSGSAGALAAEINALAARQERHIADLQRLSRLVGTEGRLGERLAVDYNEGGWTIATFVLNALTNDLVWPTRELARVLQAIGDGDLTQRMAPPPERQLRGDVLRTSNAVNAVVDQLGVFASEVSRVAREVGTDGKLGGQARVRGASGTWRDLTDNVNGMAANLTDQVRGIARVTTAVAGGDLSQKVVVNASGEIAALANIINEMVDRLRAFASEVTRVAHEVGTEGQLGGQAQVAGVSGTWKQLTESVNQLAANLTTQVRAIADVSTAVTQGDLSREITVEARGEVGDLKDNVNSMIRNLRETSRQSAEQEWLKGNLARLGALLQGQRDLGAVARVVMRELTPLVGAVQGAFWTATANGSVHQELHLAASYALEDRGAARRRIAFGEGLVGQAAVERTPIALAELPPDYLRVTSTLGATSPVDLLVLPVLFEDHTLGVIELAALHHFTPVERSLLEQAAETIGVVLSTIEATMRTEELLLESQHLAEELRAQQEELKRSNTELEEQARTLTASEELLQRQQHELQQTNEELEEKAVLLSEQNRAIEQQNREIEGARASLEEKAQQLSVSSRYKSEFLANMSHELRTPLNSVLILAKLLSDNPQSNLTERQVEFARTIHHAGTDLLTLINDILDLSKVEAGRMDITLAPLRLADLAEAARRAFAPLAEGQHLSFDVTLAEGVPETIDTDEQRLWQVLKNLLSNALKFTEQGGVSLEVTAAPPPSSLFSHALRSLPSVLSFAVRDSGIGIPVEKVPMIFEAFQQADGTTSRRFGGTGLGLSISREIARLLGGEIRVDSVVGRGSTFTLYLPPSLDAVTAVPAPPLTSAATETVDVDLVGPVQRPAAAAGIAAGRRGAEDPATSTVEAGDIALLVAGVRDDRTHIRPGDRLLLAVVMEGAAAAAAAAAAHERGFKVLLAVDLGGALQDAHEHNPDAILIDVSDEDESLHLLDRLKRDAELRHIPVAVVAPESHRQRVLAGGAAHHLTADDGLDLVAALDHLADVIDREIRRLLIVDDDARQLDTIRVLVEAPGVEVTAVQSSEDALAALHTRRFDAIVLDLSMPSMDGFALLEHMRGEPGLGEIPVIVYTGRDLTRGEETRLRKYAESIVVKDARSPERLLDEVTLFLHRPRHALPREQREIIDQLHRAESVFDGKRVLIVDDDVRNVFALTSALEPHGMVVLFAENGREGIEALRANADIAIVLMDIMMPEMDGYETMQAIRAMGGYERLPIIALTAKAMKGDRERTIASGASDYITKPVDLTQLLSLMRVWLYR